MIDWLERLLFSNNTKRMQPHRFSGIWDEPSLPSFADVLPYDMFNPKNMLFELCDGDHQKALGFSLECLPQIGSSEQIEATLEDLPLLLHAGCCLQVNLYADPNVKKQISSYCNARSGPTHERGTGLHRKMARRRFDHFMQLGNDLSLYDFRLIISVIVDGSLGDVAVEQQLIKLRQSIETNLAGCSIPTRSLTPADLIHMVGGIINPHNPSRRGFSYDNNEAIASQCVLRDTTIDVTSNSIEVSGDGETHQFVSLYASRYPTSLRLGGMLGLLGEPLRSNLCYLGPFVISMCMMMVNQESMRSLVALKRARASSNIKSVMARLMPGYYKRQYESWQICSEAIDNGAGMVLLYHQVLAQAPLGQLAVAEERARAVWRARGFTLAKNEYLQLHGLLATLPLTLTPGFAHDMKTLGLMTHKTTHNAAHGLPVISEWKGTNSPAMLMVGRRGQIMNIDIFDSGGNHNLVIAGTSGSGKSVLLNEIAVSALALGAKVWIFDIGRSYLRTCEAYGGHSIQFGPNATVGLNPFSAIVDIDEDMRLLKPLFAQMIAPHGKLSDLQRSHLELAIKQTWHSLGHKATPADLQKILAKTGEKDPRIADMAAMLGPYATGIHAKWFNGPATINLKADMVVFELEELSNDRELQTVITLQLLYFVTQNMYSSRDRRKLVLIDEAYELMLGENVAEFIEQGYRRARKYNGAFLSATQSVGDYYANSAGRSAIANSDWMMLLSQKDEEIKQLTASGQLILSEAECQQVLSLRTKARSYSEIFIRCEGVASGVGRLTLDPYTELLFSSNATDQKELDFYLGRGLNLEQSIDAVIKHRNHETV